MSASARESGARLREEVQRALARSAKETTRVWFEHDSSSRQSFTSPSRLSSSKRKTVSAIVNASESSEMIRDARMHRSPRSWKYSYI